MQEVIIIGGGPSALSAAIYLGRFERKTSFVCDSFGGQAVIAGELENYPGFESISGPELINKMVAQVKNLGSVEAEIGQKINRISKIEGGFEVSSDNKTYKAKTVLIATGRSHRKLGLKGEDELVGKGVSYCAVCDAPFAKGKEVVVIGGGYAATEAALILSKVASKITIVNINEKLSGEDVIINKVKNDPKITVVSNAKTTDFALDQDRLTGVMYENIATHESKTASGQFVFVEIGQVPNSKDFADIVKLNEIGEIIVDPTNNMTDQKGIFASGDIASFSAKQIIAACGDGAKAAISINSYLESN